MKYRIPTSVVQVCIAVVSVVFALVVAEMMLRIFSVRPRMFFVRKDNLRLSDNPILGYELVPNARGINSWGFRGGDVRIPKPKQTYRILVLGDSVAYGCCDVPLRQTFAKRLEARLNHFRKGKTYEVLDAGVLGYNTLQEAEYYGSRLRALEPDLIILQVSLNDYLPRTFEFDTVALSQQTPYERKTTYGYYELIQRMGRMLTSSYLVQNMLYAYEFSKVRAGTGGQPDVLGEAIDAANTGGVLTYRMSNASWTTSDIIPTGMERLHSYTDPAHIPVVSAVFPVFVAEMNPYPLNYGMQHTKIDAESTAAGFHTLDLTACYQSVWRPGTSFDIGDGVHPNRYGHERAAECLYNYLTGNHLL